MHKNFQYTDSSKQDIPIPTKSKAIITCNGNMANNSKQGLP